MTRSIDLGRNFTGNDVEASGSRGTHFTDFTRNDVGASGSRGTHFTDFTRNDVGASGSRDATSKKSFWGKTKDALFGNPEVIEKIATLTSHSEMLQTSRSEAMKQSKQIMLKERDIPIIESREVRFRGAPPQIPRRHAELREEVVKTNNALKENIRGFESINSEIQRCMTGLKQGTQEYRKLSQLRYNNRESIWANGVQINRNEDLVKPPPYQQTQEPSSDSSRRDIPPPYQQTQEPSSDSLPPSGN